MKRVHHPLTPSTSEKEWEEKAPSSSEEGVGGGGVTRQTLLKRAAAMRANPTEPERRLWMALRDSRLTGFKFRRQVIMGWRIVDFFCPAKALVIEIDGETHDRERDDKRDAALIAATGFRVLRFTNLEIMRECDGVLALIALALETAPDRWAGRHHPPTPSSEEEGEPVEREAPSSSEEGVGGGGAKP